jgi:hypothetical protein
MTFLDALRILASRALASTSNAAETLTVHRAIAEAFTRIDDELADNARAAIGAIIDAEEAQAKLALDLREGPRPDGITQDSDGPDLGHQPIGTVHFSVLKHEQTH